MPIKKSKSVKRNVKAKSRTAKKKVSAAKKVRTREKVEKKPAVDPFGENTLQVVNLDRDELQKRVLQQALQVIESRKKFEDEVEQRKQVTEAFDNLSRRNELILSAAGEGIYGVDRGSFVLTHMSGPPPEDNEIIQGKWWSEKEASIPQVSLEEDAALRLGVAIGSELTMEIQGIRVTAPVTSIRKVNWRNMRTNFYMIYSPGALTGAPITFVATVRVSRDKELPLQQAVVDALPNVTALSTRDIINTVETVVDKLKTLVDFMSAFSILSGLFILSGSVASTKFRRLKESAILKILGARRKAVASILGVEYATLGIVAGIMGIGLSTLLSWGVMKYLVKSGWHLYPAVMLWTLVLSVLLTTLTGILSSLDVIKNKPLATLRKADA